MSTIESEVFGGLGGRVVTYEWDASSLDRDIAALLQTADYIGNVEMPLLVAAGVMQRETQERFNTETDPDGTPWVPLDEEYLARKVGAGFPADILHRTGKLESAATSPAAWLVENDTLAFNPSLLPEYGILHQTGSGVENVGLASQHRFQMSERRQGRNPDYETEGGAHANLGVGRGNALPQRRFIGISEEAAADIGAAFDLWYDEAVQVYVNPRSRIMQERGAGGRFGRRVI